MSPETEAMWKTLSKMAMENKELFIAERYSENDILKQICLSYYLNPLFLSSYSALIFFLT